MKDLISHRVDSSEEAMNPEKPSDVSEQDHTPVKLGGKTGFRFLKPSSTAGVLHDPRQISHLTFPCLSFPHLQNGEKSTFLPHRSDRKIGTLMTAKLSDTSAADPR